MEDEAPFGAGTFAVAARHRDTEGYYPLLMPMTTEQAVIGGRETFGEPKKLADITLETVPEQSSGSAVRGLVTRMGVGIIELDGTLGDELDPPPSGERLDYYLKFLRDPGGAGFDDDPWLVYCTRETETRSHRAANVALTLRESLRSGGRHPDPRTGDRHAVRAAEPTGGPSGGAGARGRRPPLRAPTL